MRRRYSQCPRPTTDRGEVRDAVLDVSGPLHPDGRSWYFGSREDVRVRSGTATGSLRVMDEAGYGMG